MYTELIFWAWIVSGLAFIVMSKSLKHKLDLGSIIFVFIGPIAWTSLAINGIAAYHSRKKGREINFDGPVIEISLIASCIIWMPVILWIVTFLKANG